MRNIQIIKSLAKESIDHRGNVNNSIAEYVLKKLTKKELKFFLRALKKKHMEGNVTIKYDGNLSETIKREFDKMFENKRITYIKDEKIGGGIEVVDNDMIVNYSVAGIINNRLESINI